ncbi:MAG: PIG-L family deacetylase [Acidobacteriota bacterium]
MGFKTSRVKSFLWVGLLLASALPLLCGQPPGLLEDQGITGLGLALRKLPNVGSILYITAHPDDENNALLAQLSRGRGLRTGLLTLTRGDGGQNEIGSELFEALGVLRTEELMTIHLFDGAQQFFTRAYEFGYSFSVEETFEKWGKEETLGDIVRVIRAFRPHVILTLSPDGKGGGQHHQASALLAAEAFRLAGDPASFPEQLQEGLRPWQPLRLYQSARPPEAQDKSSQEKFEGLEIEVGSYDPLLGETYAEFGARARSNHRCQGMNVLPQPGSRKAYFRLADETLPTSKTDPDFFAGIEISLAGSGARFPEQESQWRQLQAEVERAQSSFSRMDYPTTAKAIMNGLERVRRLRQSRQDFETQFLLAAKEKDFLAAASKACFIHFDALAKGLDDSVTPEEEFEVEVRFIGQAPQPPKLERVVLLAPRDWKVQFEKEENHSHFFQVKVAANADYTRPYWFRADRNVDRYSVRPGFAGTEPVSPPALIARAEYTAWGVSAWLQTPVRHRWFDAESAKERRSDVQVVPKLSVALKPSVAVVGLASLAQPRSFHVTLRNHSCGKNGATVRLDAPEGWRVEPAEGRVEFRYQNEKATLAFSVSPPIGLSPGKYTLEASARVGDEVFRHDLQTIAYHHIQTRHLYHPAVSTVRVFDVSVAPDLDVGYVMGVGDEVPSATEDLGARVTLLGPDDLASGDLGRFDVIVTGIRAYLNRQDLIANNHRLLQYVHNGGHLVVQYNKYEFNRAQYGPYPAQINRPNDRVTVEDSPVQVLEPEHPLFNSPNLITARDWDNWVQERGLYFLGEWDEHYLPLLELRDPWPYNHQVKRGSLLIASYGQGTYLYTGLGFFRQLPQGVAGAFRLWANILSLGQHEEAMRR